MATWSPEAEEHPPDAGVSAVLDIGGDVGAAVVRLDGPTPTGELEARPRGRSADRFHTGVHRRTTSGRWQWLAIFPDVTAGDYELLDDAGQPVVEFSVTGGRVTELELG